VFNRCSSFKLGLFETSDLIDLFHAFAVQFSKNITESPSRRLFDHIMSAHKKQVLILGDFYESADKE